MAINIVKIRVWNGFQTMWDSFQTSIFNTENLSFLEPYMHAQDRARLCMHHGLFLPAHAESFLGLIFPKRFICSLKVIFFILTFLKSI